MEIIPFIIVGFIFLTIDMLVEHYLKKKYNISKSKGWIYHPINRIHSGLEVILFILLIITLIFFNAAAMGILAYATLNNALRAWMEWRYGHEEKHYLLSLSSAVFLAAFLIVVVATRILPI